MNGNRNRTGRMQLWEGVRHASTGSIANTLLTANLLPIELDCLREESLTAREVHQDEPEFYIAGDRLHICIMGELTQGLTARIVRKMRRNELQIANSVREIHMSILTPGGQTAAMKRLLVCLNDFCERFGLTIATFGDYEVCSAGAIILASGTIGHRYLYEGAVFLAHDARISEVKNLTLTRIDHLRANIEGVNESILLHLTKIIGATCLDRARQECEAHMPQEPKIRWPIEAPTDGWLASIVGKPRVFKSADKLLTKIHSDLKQIFECDRSFSPQSARALGLVDHVLEY